MTKEIIFSYEELEKLISEHKKTIRKQTKSNLGIPQKVIVYEDKGIKSFRYEY